MSNPRIYIVIGTFLPIVGGAEKQALEQGRSIQQRDYTATIITFRHNSAWSSHEVMAGVPIMRVAGTLLGRREQFPRLLQQVLYILALLVMGWTLWRQRKCYDILHVYQLTLLVVPVALVCWVTGKRMLVGVRCTDTGKKASFNSRDIMIAGPLDPALSWLEIEGVPRFDGDLSDLERLGSVIVRFTHALLLRVDARIIILSSQMWNYMDAHDFTFRDTELIPNGVDVHRFTPVDEEASLVGERSQIVLCVARLHYQKGIDVLLQAWRIVQAQSSQARLVIVGSGPIQMQLECMTQALGIAASVEFAGLHDDIAKQLQRGALAVLPSRWEGMSNALLEAMACGLACVATRVSGNEEIIQHGVNGLLVDSEDYEGMADALLRLIQDAELAEKYGKAARLTIEQHYSLEQITDKYINQYQRMMSEQ